MCLCTNGKHLQVKTHSQTILYTWVFEEDSFSPIAKIKKDKQYSIINDHLGTPIEAYADDGKLIWERSLNSNGKVLKDAGLEPTKEAIELMVKKIDDTFGHLFNPPVK
jgi:hypothetical protein